MPFDRRHEYTFYKLKGYCLELRLASASSACLEPVFNLPKAEGMVCLSDGSIYPRLKFYVQAALDLSDGRTVCDLVDGMNLTKTWAEHAALELGPSTMKRNDGTVAVIQRKDILERAIENKQKRIGWVQEPTAWTTQYCQRRDGDPTRYIDN